tara:strand:+ start:2232 stop:2513 length:282 start_codon:yes stop_codon:yes gene_type:complete
MTVKELIEQLSKYNGDMEVLGGDWCTGVTDRDCGQEVFLSPIICKEISVADHALYGEEYGDYLVTDLDRNPNNHSAHPFTTVEDKSRKAIYLS